MKLRGFVLQRDCGCVFASRDAVGGEQFGETIGRCIRHRVDLWIGIAVVMGVVLSTVKLAEWALS